MFYKLYVINEYLDVFMNYHIILIPALEGPSIHLTLNDLKKY